LRPRSVWRDRAAAVHLAYFELVALFLALEGFDTPKAPLIVAGAIALDLSSQRRWPIPIQAAVSVAAMYAVYVPSLDVLGHGVRLDAADVAIGLPVSYVAVVASLTVIFGRWPRPRPLHRLATATLLMLGLLLLFAAPALARDPGQGDPAGSFDLRARLEGHVLGVVAQRDAGACDELIPSGIVARRAGDVERGTLQRQAVSSAARFGCRARAGGSSTSTRAAATRASNPGSRSRSARASIDSWPQTALPMSPIESPRLR
jgi:hypothetical protein